MDPNALIADKINTGKNLEPSKLVHIKRPTEIALIFDGTLIQVGHVWRPSTSSPVGTALDASRVICSGAPLADNQLCPGDGPERRCSDRPSTAPGQQASAQKSQKPPCEAAKPHR